MRYTYVLSGLASYVDVCFCQMKKYCQILPSFELVTVSLEA
jgi:hypothetical protein